MTLPASITLTQTAVGPVFQLADGSTQPALTPSYVAWLTGLARQATQEQLASLEVVLLAVMPAATGAGGVPVPAQAFSAGLGQIVTAVVPTAAAQALAQAQQVAWITISGPTALTLAEHGGKGIVLLPGATVSLAWADTGPAFSCLISNETGGPIQPQLDTAFTIPVPRNASGVTQIADQGTAAIYCQSWTDSSGTVNQVCRMVGELVG